MNNQLIRVAFRTDASTTIGSGHVMRCLSLANSLRKSGVSCTFITREHEGNINNLIHSCGHHIVALQKLNASYLASESNKAETTEEYSVWLGCDSETDAKLTMDAIGNARFKWLIVDHYGLDARWERMVRSSCERLMVIDDLANRPHDCDLLLDQNFGRLESDYIGLIGPETTLMIGPKYALLRPEFGELRNESLARRAAPIVKNILICMGGVDKKNVTSRVLETLMQCPLPLDARILVVMGQNAPWLMDVKKQAIKMTYNTEVLVNVRNMARLMMESDLCIGAGGSALWERCTLGLPSLVYCIAENQVHSIQALSAVSAIKIINTIGHESLEICSVINELIARPSELTTLTRSASAIMQDWDMRLVTDYLVEKIVKIPR